MHDIAGDRREDEYGKKVIVEKSLHLFHVWRLNIVEHTKIRTVIFVQYSVTYFSYYVRWGFFL